MIDRNHDLPIVRQAKILNISRGSVYYQPRPASPKDFALMRRIDELHLEFLFAGSRMLRDFLSREGLSVGRRHVATLMKRMHAYDSVGVARASIGRYLDFYNRRRPHSSLDRRTPDEAYFEKTPCLAAA